MMIGSPQGPKKHAAEPKDVEFGQEKRSVYISLPFTGPNSLKLNRQLNRLMTKIAPVIDLNITFKATCRHEAISKLRSPISIRIMFSVTNE